MAITTLSQFVLPAPIDVDAGSAWGTSSVVMNAAGDKCAFAFRVPKSGTLDTFEWRSAAVANNPDNGIRVSFQDLDATGVPDGTQDQWRDVTGAISANTWQTTGLMTNDGTDTGVKRTVTAGQWLAVAFEFVTFVAADSIGISILGGNASARQHNNSYVCDGSTGTYAKSSANYPLGALKYNDGTYAEFAMHGIYPITSADSTTFNSGSTPDEYAVRFQLPYKARVVGWWASGDFAGDGVQIHLYSGTTSLASDTVDANDVYSALNNIRHGYFDTAQELTANTTYRVSVKPTTVTNTALNRFTFNSSTYLAALNPGAQWYESTRTDAGAWSDSQTTRPWIGLIIDGIEFTTSSGGGGSFTFVG